MRDKVRFEASTCVPSTRSNTLLLYHTPLLTVSDALYHTLDLRWAEGKQESWNANTVSPKAHNYHNSTIHR